MGRSHSRASRRAHLPSAGLCCGGLGGAYFWGVIRAPVSRYATQKIVPVQATDTLDVARRLLQEHGISAMPVIGEEEGRPVGVISRTDLLHAGRSVRGVGALSLPGDALVRDLMGHGLTTVAPTTSVGEAARLMVDGHIHRVFIEEDRALTGVFSTKDVMRALVDARIETPISRLMHSPVDTVNANAPLSRAVELLAESHHSGLVVDEDGWSLGVFTQIEALAAADADAATPVRSVMGFSLLRLPCDTPVHQAVAEAFATRARRILAMAAPAELRGLLSGIDLSGAAIVS